MDLISISIVFIISIYNWFAALNESFKHVIYMYMIPTIIIAQTCRSYYMIIKDNYENDHKLYLLYMYIVHK